MCINFALLAIYRVCFLQVSRGAFPRIDQGEIHEYYDGSNRKFGVNHSFTDCAQDIFPDKLQLVAALRAIQLFIIFAGINIQGSLGGLGDILLSPPKYVQLFCSDNTRTRFLQIIFLDILE